MALNDKQATELLDSLLKRKGVLKVITSEVLPKLRLDSKDARSSPDPAKNVDLRDPASWVQHDVVSVAPHRVRTSHLVARTAEGDHVESYDGPMALLVRLLEWNYYDVNNPASSKGKVEAVVEAMYQALHSEGDK